MTENKKKKVTKWTPTGTIKLHAEMIVDEFMKNKGFGDILRSVQIQNCDMKFYETVYIMIYYHLINQVSIETSKIWCFLLEFFNLNWLLCPVNYQSNIKGKISQKIALENKKVLMFVIKLMKNLQNLTDEIYTFYCWKIDILRLKTFLQSWTFRRFIYLV